MILPPIVNEEGRNYIRSQILRLSKEIWWNVSSDKNSYPLIVKIRRKRSVHFMVATSGCTVGLVCKLCVASNIFIVFFIKICSVGQAGRKKSCILRQVFFARTGACCWAPFNFIKKLRIAIFATSSLDYSLEWLKGIFLENTDCKKFIFSCVERFQAHLNHSWTI